MSDCTNVAVRESLPELLHGRLDAASARQVREHLAACAECAAELELLERVQRAYAASAAAVDTAALVRALPAPRRKRFSLGGVRMAAAVALLIAGGLVLRAVVTQPERGDPSMAVGAGGGGGDTAGIAAPSDTAKSAVPPGGSPARAPIVLAMSLGELDGLDEEGLENLLGALESIDAAPMAEPDTLIGSVRGIGT